MKVDIITPDTILFSGDDVHLVQLPGIDGSFEIMNHHAPLISVLKKGKIKIEADGQSPRFFEVKGGVIEVANNKVLVLAE
ncbi:MAG: ATP synthase F1 subunit epsilon [Bacteroidetes bacterium]|nr:ATP synthase F1 subunit epsilon [Bacteroidota bacterium]